MKFTTIKQLFTIKNEGQFSLRFVVGDDDHELVDDHGVDDHELVDDRGVAIPGQVDSVCRRPL